MRRKRWQRRKLPRRRQHQPKLSMTKKVDLN
jgi:hypothetical protein